MTIDFGVVRGVDAQSFGEPGQRTFRLRVAGSRQRTAFLWLEKEHLRALSLALRQVLSEFDYQEAPPQAEPLDFPEAADHDVRVGRLGVGVSRSHRRVILEVEELEEKADALRFQLTLELCASLIEQLDGIIAAGRPTCFLCGQPIEAAGHVCVRSNGHSRQPIPEEAADDDEDE